MSPFVKCLLVFLICGITFSHAQRRKIIVDNNLIANSKELKVSYKFRKNTMEFSCSDYKIVDSKINYGNIEETLSAGVKEHSRHHEFWFLMKNDANQSVELNSVYDRKSKFEDRSNLLDLLSGDDDTYELTDMESLRTATILTSFDTLNNWILNDKHLHSGESKHCQMTLSNGLRTIEIIDAQPIKPGTYFWTSPALGYQFIENGQTLAAYQSQGGAAIGLGSKQQLVWLRNTLDDETEMVLVAVMAAL